MFKMYLGLVHYPIKSKTGDVITTSITNMDIHDISRSCRTFGFEKYFLISPLKIQHQLVQKILGFWESDEGVIYNPDRKSSLGLVQLMDSVEMAIEEITKREGKSPCVVVTGANFSEFDGNEEKLLERLKLDGRPMFLLFGTGWGLTASITDSADYRLEPLVGMATDGYNHLSVRSAVAIYLDRIARSL